MNHIMNEMLAGAMVPNNTNQLNEPSVKELLIAVLTEEKKISSLLETIVNGTSSTHAHAHAHAVPPQQFNNRPLPSQNGIPMSMSMSMPMIPMGFQGYASNATRSNIDQFKPVIQILAEAQTSLARNISAAVGKINPGNGPLPNNAPVHVHGLVQNKPRPVPPHPNQNQASLPAAVVNVTTQSQARDTSQNGSSPSQQDASISTVQGNHDHAQQPPSDNNAGAKNNNNIARFMAPAPKYSAGEKKKIQELLLAQHSTKQLSPQDLDKLLNAYMQSEVLQQNDEAETVAALLNLSGGQPDSNSADRTTRTTINQEEPLRKNATSQPQPRGAARPLPSRKAAGASTKKPSSTPAPGGTSSLVAVAGRPKDGGDTKVIEARDTNTYTFPEGTLLRTFLKPTDMHLVTQFTYAILSELEVAYFTWRDRRGNRRKLTMGYPGMACRYCKGETGRTGRYFPSSVKTMADSKKTLFSVYDHLSCCQKCPTIVKKQLLQLFGEHVDEQGKKVKRHGSQRDFFRRVYNMLHSIKPPQK